MDELENNEAFCNRCGQLISLDEYESNINGFCEDCQEEQEEFEQECLYHEEDWEDYWNREREAEKDDI